MSVDGLWETPDLAALLELLYRNFRSYALPPLGRLGRLLCQLNRKVVARRQIVHHPNPDEDWIPATPELTGASLGIMKNRYHTFVSHGRIPACSTAHDFSRRSDVR